MHVEKMNLEHSQDAELTLYLHELSDEMPHMKERPAVLVCPGGGYGMVSDRENEPVALGFLAKGFQVFVLKYSVGERARNMQPLMEAADAMKTIRKNAQKWHVIPNQIAVCGFSAGAHLAGSIGILSAREELLQKVDATDEQIRPNAMILCYPVITSGEFAHRGSFFNLTGFDMDEEHNQSYSLERYIDERTPGAFIWHTVDDGSVPVENSILLVNELQKHKRPYEVHLFDSGSHGLSLCNQEVNSPSLHCAHWFDLCVEWLKRYFKLQF